MSLRTNVLKRAVPLGIAFAACLVPSAVQAATATFVKADTTTGGSWKGNYGGDGCDVISDTSTALPSYVSALTPHSNLAGTWTSSSLAANCLQRTAAGSTDRLAGVWYQTTWTMSLNVASGTHQVALYMFDINNAGYGETITINDATTGTVLDTRSASSFANGEYLVWNISGSVTFTLTGTTNGGHWAVLNGVFFGPGAGTKAAAAPSGLTATTGQDQISLAWAASTGATSYAIYRSSTTGTESGTPIATGVTGTSFVDTAPAAGANYYKVVAVNAGGGSPGSSEASAATTSATASFVSSDTNAGGSWKGIYGGDGYYVFGDTSANNPSYPSYATAPGTTGVSTGLWGVTSTANSNQAYPFDPSSNGPYYLSTAAPGSLLRTLGVWYATTSFTITNLQLGPTPRPLSLYMYDWGGAGRAQTIQIEDAISHAVLSTQTVAAGLGGANGDWLTWDLAGTINIVVTKTAGPNCVLNGIFFGGQVPTLTPIAPRNVAVVPGDAQTTLSWVGSDSLGNAATYNVYRSTTIGGEGVTPLASNLTTTSWTDTTASAGHTYYYKIAAVNGLGTSAMSAEVNAMPSGIPAAPTGIFASMGTTPDIHWLPSAGATSYNVYRGTMSGGEVLYATGATIYQNAQNPNVAWPDPSSTNGTTYFYKVAAVNASGTSPLSTEISINATANESPLGGAPSFVNLGPATNEATVNWDAVPTATFYVIWRYATGSPVINPVPVAVVPSNTGNTGPYVYTDLNVPANKYTYGVQAGNALCTAGTLFFGYLQAAVVAEPTSGVIMPKYQILSVMYAPPGLGSLNTATYTNSNSFGTSTTFSKSYVSQNTITASVTSGVRIYPFTFSQTTTGTAMESSETDDNSAVTVSQVNQVSTTIGGPGAYGVNHDNDIIYLWLNPVLTVTTNPTVGVGLENPMPLTWTGYAYNQDDPANNMDVVGVPVGVLNGDQPMPPGIGALLERSWAGSSSNGAGPGLTAADFADILKADPPASPTYSFTLGSDGITTVDGRFTKANCNAFEYYWEGANIIPKAQIFMSQSVNTNSTGQGGSDVHQTGFTEEFKYMLNVGPSTTSPAGLMFGFINGADLKAQGQYTWTNKWSSTVTSTNTNTATISITQPSGPTNPYTGPSLIDIYQDNVYGTFVYIPVGP